MKDRTADKDAYALEKILLVLVIASIKNNKAHAYEAFLKDDLRERLLVEILAPNGARDKSHRGPLQ